MDNIKAYDCSTYNIGILNVLYDIDDKIEYITLHDNKKHTAKIHYNRRGESYFNSEYGRIYLNNCMYTNI